MTLQQRNRPHVDPWALARLERTAALSSIRERIGALADADNLAAVIVHLNDTYLIEEQLPGVPGLSRIAGAIDNVRTVVRQRLGVDRTLVCHGGDYLGPSRLSRELEGAQMVDLLRHCGLNVSTLGNHEFDHDSGPEWGVLHRRLVESQHPSGSGTPFKTVLSNLCPGDVPDRSLFDRLVLWPLRPAIPLFAVIGYAGEQTVKVARAHGFLQTSTEEMLDKLNDALLGTPSILAIVVLTHASRDEDRSLQRLMRKRFPEHAIYLLGGHDHHMEWAERVDNTVLLKCLSNGRSLGVVPVPKDGLTAVRIRYPRVPRARGLTREAECQIMHTADDQEGRHLSGPLLDRPDIVLCETVTGLHSSVGEALLGQHSDDFLRAFEQRIGRTLQDSLELLRGSYASDLSFDLVSIALADARHHLGNVATILDCSRAANTFPVHTAAQEATAKWLAQCQQAVDEGCGIVVDFEPYARGLDARDRWIRVRSTDFGNFVADAICHATGAVVALVNSGCLRGDDVLPARLTRKRLRDVLLYDGESAGAVVALSADEVRRMLDYARTKCDHGAFLQLSAGCESALERKGESLLRVAIVRHMIAAPHDEDGYCAVLAAEGESWKQAQVRLLARVQETGSLEDWVCAGAPHVRYSNEPRLSSEPQMSRAEADAENFIGLADHYRAVCQAAGLRPFQMLSTSMEQHCSEEVHRALDTLVNFADRGYALGPGARDTWFTEVYQRLMSDESNYVSLLEGEQTPIRYHAYLDLAVELLDARRNLGGAVFRYRG